ncbi:MAG: YHYH protein [Chloroflexi bacterium]|nr:MAG: YHYH protein [Chloroflexota bacterium]MBL1194596.1 YHYH protein [Chloroflexota bacterium]NOH11885.1 YHYH protein [Chloroflexota bacterium]
MSIKKMAFVFIGSLALVGFSVIPTLAQSGTGDEINTVNSQTAVDCPDEHFIDVQADPNNSAYADPELNVYCTESTVVVESNGIPNFEFVSTTPNGLQAQNYTWEIPLEPVVAAQTSDIPLLGTIGFTVNGLPIFGPNEAPTHGYGDPYLDGLLDYCNGHTAQQGMYHYHARPDCLFEDMEGNPYLVIGYAFDGFPILAPYICDDAGCNTVSEVQSSWQRTNDVRNAWEAHEYVAGSGDLDQCNGTYLTDGSYAYFATDTFPYFLGCYTGEVSGNTGNGGAPQDGQQQGNPQGTAPQDTAGQGQTNAAAPQGGPDLSAAAAQLGVSEEALRNALGAPPPDLAAAAQALGVSEDALRQALGVPAGGGPNGGGPPRGGRP